MRSVHAECLQMDGEPRDGEGVKAICRAQEVVAGPDIALSSNTVVRVKDTMNFSFSS